jgi:hypothetical protein
VHCVGSEKGRAAFVCEEIYGIGKKRNIASGCIQDFPFDFEFSAFTSDGYHTLYQGSQWIDELKRLH